VSLSTEMVQKIFDLYEEAASPDGEEVKSDLLKELAIMRASFTPSKEQEFNEFVVWMNQFRNFAGTFQGDIDGLLERFHPWQLQQIVQRFKPFGHTPEETPEV
jgi:hypothetical protein